jgi:hypothetical protein
MASPNPLERLNREIGRWADVAHLFASRCGIAARGGGVDGVRRCMGGVPAAVLQPNVDGQTGRPSTRAGRVAGFTEATRLAGHYEAETFTTLDRT